MADITITASSVIPGANATIVNAVAGASIAAGDVLYKDTADNNTMKLADANGGTAIIRTVAGIAVCSAAAGQRVSYVSEDDDLTLGSALFTVGDIVILSATPGRLAPQADATTGWFKTILGIAKSTSKIIFKPLANSVANG
jgi:hypothetical protein